MLNLHKKCLDLYSRSTICILEFVVKSSQVSSYDHVQYLHEPNHIIFVGDLIVVLLKEYVLAIAIIRKINVYCCNYFVAFAVSVHYIGFKSAHQGISGNQACVFFR